MHPDKKMLKRLLESTIQSLKNTERAFQHAVSRCILCDESNPAGKAELSRYFDLSGLPGTTSIGERKRNPELFRDTSLSAYETYEQWVGRNTRKILEKMMSSGALPGIVTLTESTIDTLAGKVTALLEFETPDSVPLCEAIPQQMYEDILIRIIVLLLNSNASVNLYAEFNTLCHRIAVTLIHRLENNGSDEVSVSKLIQLAVLSGYIGINLKSSASAASKLLNRNLIPIPKQWIQNMTVVMSVPESEIVHIVEKILAICVTPEGQFGLESLSRYHSEVVETEHPTLVTFFSDDYLESILDMKRFEILLKNNPNLTVLFIPRNGRYGNDLAIEDVDPILKESFFATLRRFITEERFVISKHGPKSGCIDPRCMETKLIHEITTLGKDRKTIFETKGCRNFEMLQGNLRVPWYAGFNCNRALSIRTVGVDGLPVFLRIPPGMKAFDLFREPKIGYSTLYEGAEVKFAGLTTKKLYEALDSDIYRRLAAMAHDELQLNISLTHICDNLHITFTELLHLLEKRHI